MGRMTPLGEVTRTLTLVLPESDWRALRAVEPDAVKWLHSQIRERLSAEPQPATAVSPATTTETPNPA